MPHEKADDVLQTMLLAVIVGATNLAPKLSNNLDDVVPFFCLEGPPVPRSSNKVGRKGAKMYGTCAADLPSAAEIRLRGAVFEEHTWTRVGTIGRWNKRWGGRNGGGGERIMPYG